jgi:hypothetical protein
MANDGQSPDPFQFTAEDEIDQVLARANPNPHRKGCPPRDVLAALASRERPIEDPAYQHLVQCSPCYREFRAIQQGRVGASPARASARAAWPLGVAAVLLLAAAVGWFALSGDRARDDGADPAPSGAADLRAELDLRNYAVTRSDQAADPQPPLVLPRGRVELTLLLPVGSEPGPYEVRLIDDNLQTRAAGSGSAELRDYVTRLHTSLHLSSVAPGRYNLALRQAAEAWQLFPVQLNGEFDR